MDNFVVKVFQCCGFSLLVSFGFQFFHEYLFIMYKGEGKMT